MNSPGHHERPITRGRPASTSPAEIEQAAFRLFSEQGFDGTTLSGIAALVGVGQRTLTRYYRSKNDIPWGQFDLTLDHFRNLLAAMPSELPLWERVHRGVVAFNDFPADAQPSHRERMRLILTTPALQAHAMLRYEQWRGVISDYVAGQLDQPRSSTLPRLVGHVSLALAIDAYERWLEQEYVDGAAERDALRDLLSQSMRELRAYLT